MGFRTSKDGLSDMFESRIWEDIVDLIDVQMCSYQAILESPDSEDKQIRVAQGAVSMGNWVLDLPEYIADNYEAIQKEEEQDV